jgi:DNA-binding Xre family transcriptional regulator
VSGLVASAEQRLRVDRTGDVERLYAQRKTHVEIGETLEIAPWQVRKVITDLLAGGMAKLPQREMSDETVRAIHAAYVRRDASIDGVAQAIGFSGAAVRRRMRKLLLSRGRPGTVSRPARSRVHAEQRVITGLLMARVDELCRRRALSLEGLACESDLSLWTVHRLRRDLSDPRLTTVLRLCGGLGVSPGEMLDGLPLPSEPRDQHTKAAHS